MALGDIWSLGPLVSWAFILSWSQGSPSGRSDEQVTEAESSSKPESSENGVRVPTAAYLEHPDDASSGAWRPKKPHHRAQQRDYPSILRAFSPPGQGSGRDWTKVRSPRGAGAGKYWIGVPGLLSNRICGQVMAARVAVQSLPGASSLTGSRKHEAGSRSRNLELGHMFT